MAQTITTVISDASMASSTSMGNATKLTLQAGTNLVVVQAKLVSTAQIDRSNPIFVRFATTTLDTTASAGAAACTGDAVSIDVIPNGATSINTSDGDLNKGGFMYLWTFHSALPTGTTLSVDVIES